MRDTILIIAPEDDIHAQSVAVILDAQESISSVIWDSSTLPSQSVASYSLDGGSSNFVITNGQNLITLDSVRSVWWRRSKRAMIDAQVTDRQARAFCVRENSALLVGALAATGVPIINHPTAEVSAGRKPLQLRTAQEAGLLIPQTLMSNDPERIRAFWSKLDGKCIYKAFTSPADQLAETRLLTQEDLEYLDKLQYAPIIVQEKIEKGKDIRVNVFGDRVFAAEVGTNVVEAKIDWRLDLTAKWEDHQLPATLAQKLIDLLRKLGLHYGCIDLRQQPDGTYVFLEVNPAGQFLFIEIDTGQPLTRAFAELLLHPIQPMR